MCRFCWSFSVLLSFLLILLSHCACTKLCFHSNKSSCSRSRQGLHFSRTPLRAQDWTFGPVMIKYRAKREQVQQSASGQPALLAFPSFYSFKSPFFLSAAFFSFFFPSLSFLVSSALLFCPDKIVAFSMMAKIMRSEGWSMIWEDVALLGPKNQFLMPLKAVKDELIFIWCISSWTVGEFIQRGSFSCCFQICPGSLSFIFFCHTGSR